VPLSAVVVVSLAWILVYRQLIGSGFLGARTEVSFPLPEPGQHSFSPTVTSVLLSLLSTSLAGVELSCMRCGLLLRRPHFLELVGFLRLEISFFLSARAWRFDFVDEHDPAFGRVPDFPLLIGDRHWASIPMSRTPNWIRSLAFRFSSVAFPCGPHMGALFQMGKATYERVASHASDFKSFGYFCNLLF